MLVVSGIIIKIFLKNSIEVIDLSFNYLKFLPKRGYLNRMAYINHSLILFPLLKLLKQKKPEI